MDGENKVFILLGSSHNHGVIKGATQLQSFYYFGYRTQLSDDFTYYYLLYNIIIFVNCVNKLELATVFFFFFYILREASSQVNACVVKVSLYVVRGRHGYVPVRSVILWHT
jgi:hypothetical protein